MALPTECPSCLEYVEILTVEGVCERCALDAIDGGRLEERCEPDAVVPACAPAEE